MRTKEPKRVPASDRTMNTHTDEHSDTFFYPKHANGPVSVRAASAEEAAKHLEETNPPTV